MSRRGHAMVKREEGLNGENDELDAQRQRNLAQREKNREAVRNCRKRKKEHTKQLKERIEELVEENTKLHLELQLRGNHNPQPQAENEEEKDLVNEMLQLVRSADAENRPKKVKTGLLPRNASSAPPRNEAEMALRRKVQVYIERHQDHGRDRQKAISFILGRLQRLVEPESLTKQYLHIMTSNDGRALETKEWNQFKKELNLTRDQVAEFAKRRRYTKRLRTELDCAFDKMKSIVQRVHGNKARGDSLNEITTILRPEQFARFVVWVHSNPACKDILNELWGKLLQDCDIQINKEILSNPSAVEQIKRFQENSSALAIRLFSIASTPARERIAKLCVHPEVVLVDANNNVDKRGVDEVTRYMSFVVKAFLPQHCRKTKVVRALEVEEKSIISDQQDDKVTGTWRLTGVYIGRLVPLHGAPSSSSSGAPFGFDAEGDASSTRSSRSSSRSSSGSLPVFNLSEEEKKARTVSFNVIVEFSFADPNTPELITEMIISWDAMSLMNQLGLLNPKGKGIQPKLGPDAKQKTDSTSDSNGNKDGTDTPKKVSPEQSLSAQLCKTNALKLAKLFQSSPEVAEELASEILDPKCVFDDIHVGAKYTGIPACLGYIKRLRKAFPKFSLVARVLTQTTEPVTDGESKIPLQLNRIQLKWDVDAIYGGVLVQGGQKACEFDGKVFVTTNPKNSKIKVARLDVVAQDLMYQL
eukprot:CAMPEP_0203757692 /NCGR_PEP_ID=MMETSP0098-20131031/10635_1 /ASSEMBLY_ACC=CAM_ASM_000208 /TAXON_ID=96639 /ORGANISM=" , Strain NY0313808BC1" /LENGTH=700 /DNA_ID=CAMNT_0050649919 /DNA_START=181 /DNA_END=2279 /DNA_ORIENTATION=+